MASGPFCRPRIFFLSARCKRAPVLLTPAVSSSLFSRVNILHRRPHCLRRAAPQRGIANLPRLLAKIARSRRSSAVSSVSPLGVTLPTRISPLLTSRANADNAARVKILQGILTDVWNIAVISSGPSLVSRASASYSATWIEVRHRPSRDALKSA